MLICCCILAKADAFEEALLKLWHCLFCLSHVLNCFCKDADWGSAFLSPASVEAGVAIVVNEVAVEQVVGTLRQPRHKRLLAVE